MEYVKNLPNRKALNMHIRGEYAKVEQFIHKLQLAGSLREIDNKRLIQLLTVDKATKDDTNLFRYHAEKFIEERKNKGTKDVYHISLKALERYYDLASLRLSDIDRAMIASLARHLKEEGLKDNTIRGYIGHLRAIYMSAHRNGYVDKPFPNVTIKRTATAKRSLLVEQIRSLIEGETSALQKKYIDVFMLILYMRGINMKDLSELKSDAIHNGRIIYDREKTGKRYEIKIEPEMQSIIDRYKGKEYLLRFFDGKTPEYYKNFGNGMRQTLRRAATRLGITEPLSAYWARHSWATLAIEVGGTMELTSAGLGHTVGAPVTNVYVAYRQRQIDELARKVIDYILQKGDFKGK